MQRRAFEQDLIVWAAELGISEHGFFAPTSTTWRINRETLVYLGGLRALLMQVAHPKVAQGVADFSSFRVDPLRRLRRTLDIVHAMVFGTRSEAIAAAVRLYEVHERVRGRLAAPPPGMSAHYHANDPELLLWVFATLVDSSTYMYETVFAPLSLREHNEFYEEAKIFARLCAIPDAYIPASHEAFCAYVSEMLSGPQIVVTEAAREIANALVRGPALLRMFWPSNYILAAGTLPPVLRDAYGFAWNAPVRTTYGVGVHIARRLAPRLPARLRFVPSARRAEQRWAAGRRTAA